VSSVTRSVDEARALLGVAADSTPAAVTHAYRQLARTTHPDVSLAPDAAERFAAVSAAYEVLRHVPTRAAPLAETETAVLGPVADVGAPLFRAAPVVASGEAFRPSRWPARGTEWYFGEPEPVIVAGPVTVRPARPAGRRPSGKADR
jgi:hypothetical protein